MGFIDIYITNKNQKEADKIVNYLLKKKLIACANTYPIKSQYWWKGKIVKDNEVVALLKTRKENWTKIRDEVKKIHPYDIPCIMKNNVEANKDFEAWLKKETK